MGGDEGSHGCEHGLIAIDCPLSAVHMYPA